MKGMSEGTEEETGKVFKKETAKKIGRSLVEKLVRFPVIVSS